MLRQLELLFINNKLLKKIFLLFIIITIFGCSSTTKECENIQINPNGESELALVMRALYTNTLDIKKELFTNTDTTITNLNSINLEEFKINYNSLHTSKPTDLNLRIDGKYKRFADTYINSSKNFINNSSKENYNSMVNNCIQCHEQFCLGAIKKIQKLYTK